MYVKWLMSDNWANRRTASTKIINPSWEQIEQALTSLDGNRRTSVSLSSECGSDCYLLISGQWEGRFLVNATKNNWDFFSLIDFTRSTNKQILFVGGQNGDFAEQKMVPKDWAMQAAKVFFETGEFKKSLKWVNDYTGALLADEKGDVKVIEPVPGGGQ